MNKRLIAAVLAFSAMVVGLAPGAMALTPMAISQTDPLRFGQFAASSTAGSVTLSPRGARTASGGVILVNQDQGHAAIFAVTGDATATNFSISLSQSATLSSGASTMTLDSFVTDPPIGPNGTLAGGAATIYVGGTLHVGANQPSGSYTGAYTVTVDYY